MVLYLLLDIYIFWGIPEFNTLKLLMVFTLRSFFIVSPCFAYDTEFRLHFLRVLLLFLLTFSMDYLIYKRML